MTAITTAPGGMLNKVPEATLIFWVIKIMSTTVGETGADYLAVHVATCGGSTGSRSFSSASSARN